MIRYLNPANVDLLLVPQGDANRQRVRDLLGEVYESSLLNIEAVDSITVKAKTFQVPVVEPLDIRGTWEKVIPQGERAQASVTFPAIGQSNWIAMALETQVAVRVSISSTALDMVSSEDVSGLNQQAFVNKFKFLDVASLMAAVGVSTYAELQADFPRLYHLHYPDPPAYNPEDPASIRKYALRVSALFFPTLDIEGALRQLVQCRRALEALRPHREDYEGGRLLAASSWIGVFPTSAFNPQVTPVTQGDVSNLFTAEGFVAAFETV